MPPPTPICPTNSGSTVRPCAPGFIVASKALLDREPHPTEGRIRHWLAGNLCRCTGYQKIADAVVAAGRAVAAGR